MMRIGQGFDVHAFADGRPLILGGVEVAHDRGLAGHSDADVLIHAVCDALLGAAGLGDIGRHFPDSDPALAGIDSTRLLARVMERVAARGWRPANLDATVIAQRPKLAPYIARMVARLAQVMGVEAERINIKATTSERLGFCGREEGIAAMAVVLLERG
ncbi:MAG: 2-C-methyl-D-erythritol 2,4-cyclodiphosphate synthase [Zetaproteobacteria bacterium]|nr:MAG: 2-C-methyl-D-erythritol 2,4-cyclodiphosphate synthase [Zetaproteobacteria bacterium]